MKSYQEETIDSYNINAKLWNMTRNRFWNEYKIYIYDILDKLLINKKEINILDAGCGNGRLLFVIDQYIRNKEKEYLEINKENHKKDDKQEILTESSTKHFKINYHGFDPSPELINYAKELFPKYRDNLSVSTIMNYDSDINYDCIFSFAVFHHFNRNDFKINFDKLISILDTDGIMCITIWNVWYKYFWKIIRFYFDNLFVSKIKYNFGDYITPLFQKTTLRFVHAYTVRDIKRLVNKNNKIIELKNTYTKDKKECNILLISSKG